MQKSTCPYCGSGYGKLVDIDYKGSMDDYQIETYICHHTSSWTGLEKGCGKYYKCKCKKYDGTFIEYIK